MRLSLLAWAVLVGADSPAWLTFDQARVRSAQTGKAVLVYVGVDPRTGEFG